MICNPASIAGGVAKSFVDSYEVIKRKMREWSGGYRHERGELLQAAESANSSASHAVLGPCLNLSIRCLPTTEGGISDGASTDALKSRAVIRT